MKSEFILGELISLIRQWEKYLFFDVPQRDEETC